MYFRETFCIFVYVRNKKYRAIIFYKDYFQKFFIQQDQKIKAKIVWTFELIEDLEKVPSTYLKHLTGTEGLYEIRVKQGTDIFRVFCFFDEGKIVVIMNAFQKKSQKTPKKEVLKALKIKQEYESER